MIFGVAVLLGLAGAFGQPARTALLPAIVRPETFANAVTINSVVSSVAQVSGPLLGGAVISAAGVGEAYAVFCALGAASLLPFLLIRYVPAGGERRRVSVAALKEGVNYVRHREALLGAMSLDMFAVVFGGADALLPIFASDILGVGAFGYGVLSASLRIGGLLTAFGLVLRPPIERAGRALVYCVILYGIATIVFGLSRNFALSVAVYMFIGAVDQVSMVMRQTMIQLSTPDELRGRVSAVNQVFVGTSNQVGAMESGFVAALTSATFAVVSGGVAAVAVAALLGWRMKELFAYRVPHWSDVNPAPPSPRTPAVTQAADGGVDEPATAAGS
jgi:MFS family permease